MMITAASLVHIPAKAVTVPVEISMRLIPPSSEQYKDWQSL
jgi:hypothetical protein